MNAHIIPCPVSADAVGVAYLLFLDFPCFIFRELQQPEHSHGKVFVPHVWHC